MEIIAALFQLFIMFWFVIPFLILLPLLKSSWFKGLFGEFKVNISSKLFLDKQIYQLIKNVTLPTEDGSTQIDHIIVSKFGIFVIETKNLKGWIFGSENQKQWTQQIFKQKHSFQNPLHQNYKHVKTLEKLLDINSDKFHSLIVFVGDSKFKTSMPENVTQGGGYLKFIKSHTQELLSENEVSTIFEQINSGRLQPSISTNRNHVNHVKAIISDKSNSKNCPKCGSEMLLREAKKGTNIGQSFWGCSNFPKCRNTIKMEDV
jgi:ribosomal protein L37AE/L43A